MAEAREVVVRLTERDARTLHRILTHAQVARQEVTEEFAMRNIPLPAIADDYDHALTSILSQINPLDPH